VVGVVTAKLNDAEGINFAIRSDVALRAFEELSGLCECLTIHAPPGVPVFVNGKMAGTGPRVALVAEHAVLEVSAVVGGVMKKKSVRYPAEKVVELK
jgi:hypothetical protein